MIGFYNYTVILTYMSLVSSIIGMTLAHAGKFGAAVFCLALSGFFDMFDGKVARRKTDRTSCGQNRRNSRRCRAGEEK